MSDIKDIGTIFTSLNELEKMKLAEQQMIQKEQQFNEAQKLKIEAAEKSKNYNLTKENLKNRREENEVEIARLVKEIGNWNIVAQDWSIIDDKYQTDDGKDLLKELGLVYGENFKFKEQMSSDYKIQLKNTENLISLQDEIINDLTSKQNEILRLHGDWAQVGTEAGKLSDMKEIEDVIAYMKQEDVVDKFYNEDGSLSPLGIALTKEKTSDIDRYGFIDKSGIDSALAAISTSKDDQLQKEQDDWNAEVNFMFDEITSLEDQVLAETTDSNKKGMIAISGGKMKTFSGNQGQYNVDINQENLMYTLTNKVEKIMDWSEHFDSDSKIGKILNGMKITPGEKNTNKIDLMVELYQNIMPKDANTAIINGLWSNPEMKDINITPGYSTSFGKDTENEQKLLYKYLQGFEKMWSKLNPGKSIWDEVEE